MATNRIDILDSALLRPGRIDRKIEFPNPNEDARLDILRIHSRRMNLTRGIDLRKIATHMNDASGAETKSVCTEVHCFLSLYICVCVCVCSYMYVYIYIYTYIYIYI